MVNRFIKRPRLGIPAAYLLSGSATFLGVYIIYSAGLPKALDDGNSVLREAVTQLIIAIAMALLLPFLTRLDIGFWRKNSKAIFAGTVLLTLLTLVPGLGITRSGATRWIGAGPLTLQPSEFVKLSTVLLLAGLLASRPARKEAPKRFASLGSRLDWLSKYRWSRAVPFLVPIILALKIEREPDLGTAAVILCVMGGLLYLGGISRRSFAWLSAFGAIAAIGMVTFEGYRMERLLTFRDMWSNQNLDDAGFHASRALAAMAGAPVPIGGGPGSGWAKHFMPAATTDYAMVTIAEEFGIIGSLAVIALLGGLTYVIGKRGLEQLQRSESLTDPQALARARFAALTLIGIALWLGVQTTVNVMMANGTLPSIGIPLPFFSAGGSSLMALGLAMAIVQSAACYETIPQEQEARASGRHRRRNRRTRLSGA